MERHVRRGRRPEANSPTAHNCISPQILAVAPSILTISGKFYRGRKCDWKSENRMQYVGGGGGRVKDGRDNSIWARAKCAPLLMG